MSTYLLHVWAGRGGWLLHNWAAGRGGAGRGRGDASARARAGGQGRGAGGEYKRGDKTRTRTRTRRTSEAERCQVLGARRGGRRCVPVPGGLVPFSLLRHRATGFQCVRFRMDFLVGSRLPYALCQGARWRALLLLSCW